MATIEKLPAKTREESGTTACRRLRRNGEVPANVYGHQKDPVAIKVAADDLRPIIQGGAHVVDLEIDGGLEKALIREVQWDTYSKYVRHVDFIRVDPNERVTATVPLQLVGTPVGLQGDGILEQPLHVLQVECPAIQIPDVVRIRVSALDVGDALHVNELTDIPEGVTVLDPPESLVLQIVKSVAEEEAPAEDEGAAPSEPELITRESKDDEDDAAEG